MLVMQLSRKQFREIWAAAWLLPNGDINPFACKSKQGLDVVYDYFAAQSEDRKINLSNISEYVNGFVEYTAQEFIDECTRLNCMNTALDLCGYRREDFNLYIKYTPNYIGSFESQDKEHSPDVFVFKASKLGFIGIGSKFGEDVPGRQPLIRSKNIVVAEVQDESNKPA